MKITITSDGVKVDVQTRVDGNSSFKVLRTFDTEVYYGPLHASVALIDLGITVIMNPDKGIWEDREWARERAMTALFDPRAFEDLLRVIVAFNRTSGVQEGRTTLQRELRGLLGISGPDPIGDLK